MSSPAQTTVTVQGSASTPHWMTILAAIMASIQAVEPIIFNIIPPKVAAGIALGTAVEPVVVSTVQAVQGITAGPQQAQ